MKDLLNLIPIVTTLKHFQKLTMSFRKVQGLSTVVQRTTRDDHFLHSEAFTSLKDVVKICVVFFGVIVDALVHWISQVDSNI